MPELYVQGINYSTVDVNVMMFGARVQMGFDFDPPSSKRCRMTMWQKCMGYDFQHGIKLGRDYFNSRSRCSPGGITRPISGLRGDIKHLWIGGEKPIKYGE